jgi:hypothetical protein
MAGMAVQPPPQVLVVNMLNTMQKNKTGVSKGTTKLLKLQPYKTTALHSLQPVIQ